MPDVNDLTFGIELEVIMPTANSGEAGRTELARRLQAEGIRARSISYTHAITPEWKLTTDASIGYQNTEIVSPILHGEAGFADLRKACRVIEDFGCRVNRTTGTHVHIGVRDHFAGQVGFFKELIKTYAKYEPIIDSLVARSRRGRSNQYCMPVEYGDAIEQAANLDELAQAYGRNRFKKVNLDSFYRYGTIEFRQHQGTINGEKAENWIKLMMRMVLHAAKNTEPARDAVRRPRPPASRYVPPVYDIARAQPVPAESLTNSACRRATNLVIRHVASSNPRRPGTARYENWRHAVVGRTMQEYFQAGGRLDILRHDVTDGYVVVVNLNTAIVTPAHYEELPVEPTPAAIVVPTFDRPNTDLAPDTLDGLMELIEAPEAERAFFAERQMELNG